MKRKVKISWTFILLLLVYSSSFAVEVSFRISGGFTYPNYENINQALQDWAGIWKKKVENNPNWNFEGEVETFQRGLDFEAEFVLNINRYLAVGFGSGLIYSEIIDKKTEITIQNTEGTDVLIQPYKVTAYPLNFTGYLLLPLGKTFTIYLKGSTGKLWAKYVNWEGKKRLPEEKFDLTLQRAKATGTAKKECLGIAVRVNPYLQLFIEGSARQTKIKAFQSETEEGKNETLYFYEEYDPELDYWQAKLRILAEKPTGENFRSVEEATVDFSGYSVRIGLIIKF